MDKELEDIIHRKNFFLIRYGMLIIIIILIIAIITMESLKIDERSILSMAIEYYLH